MSDPRENKKSYQLKVNNCDFIVCKDMFLRTLGYKYDTVVTKMFEAMPTGSIKPVKDQRGRHKPKHAFSLNIFDAIDDHIESFKPMISHYHRNHAPLRRYLPPELSAKVMHEHLCQSHPDIKCCGETYRLRVKNKNIGFGRLGEEECEVCIANIQHECNAGLTLSVLGTRRAGAPEPGFFPSHLQSGCYTNIYFATT